MREIVFRGKDIDNKGWVYGALVQQQGHPLGEKTFIISYLNYQHGDFSEAVIHEIDPATVGQYTGLVDKNGKRIFEGDIIQYDDNNDISNWCRGEKAVVFCLPGRFVARMAPFNEARFTNQNYINEDFSDVCEVIGNIYDNPELLGV